MKIHFSHPPSSFPLSSHAFLDQFRDKTRLASGLKSPIRSLEKFVIAPHTLQFSACTWYSWTFGSDIGSEDTHKELERVLKDQTKRNNPRQFWVQTYLNARFTSCRKFWYITPVALSFFGLFIPYIGGYRIEANKEMAKRRFVTPVLHFKNPFGKKRRKRILPVDDKSYGSFIIRKHCFMGNCCFHFLDNIEANRDGRMRTQDFFGPRYWNCNIKIIYFSYNYMNRIDE